MITMALRFVASMARHQWARWRGYEIMAEHDEIFTRLGKCEGCPFNDDELCSKCGCLIIAKTSLALESCPVGNWGPRWVKKVPSLRRGAPTVI